jgi:hypothetical protein
VSRKDQYLKALRNRRFERLTWAPNFDYWLTVNTRNDTLPEGCRDLSRNDIVRAVGGTIWSRVSTVQPRHRYVRTERVEIGPGRWREIIHTPAGDLSTLYLVGGGEDHPLVLEEHPVKGVQDLPALLAMIRDTEFEVDGEPARRELRQVGQDGIVLDCCPCVPFLQFGKADAGWEQALYLWYDHRQAVEEVLSAYAQVHLEHIRLAAENSPAPVVHLGDNMDQLMVSPDMFRRYALPFYAEAARHVQAAGKLLEVHWCGRTGKLLPLLPGSGVDIVEAVVTAPMSDLTLEQALESLEGKVVLQGGLPSVLMCPQGGTRADLENHVAHIVQDLHPVRGFILGMADNVPPDADFQRVSMVSQMVSRAYP